MTVMVKEREEEIEAKREDYKLLMLANNLGHADKILEIFEENEHERLLTDEELETAEPMSVEELDSALSQLKNMGFVVDNFAQ